MKKPRHLKKKNKHKKRKTATQFKRYPSDLSLKQWRSIRHLFPKSECGRPRIWSYKVILNAIFYVLRRDVHGDFCLMTFPYSELSIAIFSDGPNQA